MQSSTSRWRITVLFCALSALFSLISGLPAQELGTQTQHRDLTLRHSFELASLPVEVAGISPDGKMAALYTSGSVTFIDLATRKLAFAVPVAAGVTHELVFSTSSSRLYLLRKHQLVRWASRSSETIRAVDLAKRVSIVVDPTDAELGAAIAAHDKIRASLPRATQRATGRMRMMRFDRTHGRGVIAASGKVCFWSDDGWHVLNDELPILNMTITLDERYLVYRRPSNIMIVDLATGEQRRLTVDCLSDFLPLFRGAKDSEFLVVGLDQIEVWDAGTGRRLRSVALPAMLKTELKGLDLVREPNWTGLQGMSGFLGDREAIIGRHFYHFFDAKSEQFTIVNAKSTDTGLSPFASKGRGAMVGRRRFILCRDSRDSLELWSGGVHESTLEVSGLQSVLSVLPATSKVLLKTYRGSRVVDLESKELGAEDRRKFLDARLLPSNRIVYLADSGLQILDAKTGKLSIEADFSLDPNWSEVRPAAEAMDLVDRVIVSVQSAGIGKLCVSGPWLVASVADRLRIFELR